MPALATGWALHAASPTAIHPGPAHGTKAEELQFLANEGTPGWEHIRLTCWACSKYREMFPNASRTVFGAQKNEIVPPPGSEHAFHQPSWVVSVQIPTALGFLTANDTLERLSKLIRRLPSFLPTMEARPVASTM